MRSAFSRRYVKSGRMRSIPCMFASGNISPQSMRMIERSGRRRGAVLDRHAVAADLAETAEEDDTNGVDGRQAVPRACGVSHEQRPSGRRPAGRRLESAGGSGPIGERHSPTVAEVRIMALDGTGFGARSPVSNSKLSSRRALMRCRGGVAALPRVEHLDLVGCAPVRRHADRRRRRRSPAAAASSHRRRSRSRSRPGLRPLTAAVAPGLPAASFTPTMLAHRWRGEPASVSILRPVRTGCRRAGPAGRSRRRSPGSASPGRPATGGCRTGTRRGRRRCRAWPPAR